jgi:hypothetical protein
MLRRLFTLLSALSLLPCAASLLLAFGAGCGGRDTVDIEAVNSTGGRIKNLKVSDDGTELPAPAGTLDNGYSASYGNADHPRGRKLRLSWEAADGRHPVVEVPVAEVANGPFHTLTFDLRPDGTVLVTTYPSFEAWVDRDTRPLPGRRYSAAYAPATRPSNEESSHTGRRPRTTP